MENNDTKLCVNKENDTALEPVKSESLVNKQTDIDTKSQELLTSILNTDSKEDLENLYSQFGILNTKKDVIRIQELNDLLDSVNAEAIKRFKSSPDTLSNKEIIDYMNAVQTQISNAKENISNIKDINAVQVNNTQNNIVNVHVGNQSDTQELNKDSRDKIVSFISQFLKQGEKGDSQKVIDAEFTEKKQDDKQN